MKFATIASILSAVGVATVAAADAASSSAATCVPFDGICYQNGMNYGTCCDGGICAGSRCRNPKTETGTMSMASSTATAQPTCVPFDGICFQNGKDYGACCDGGICAGSRCRNPKTEGTAKPTTTPVSNGNGQTQTGIPTGGAKVTQIGDGQIQAPTGAPTVPVVVAGAGKAIPGLAAAGAAVAFLL
ncbi:PIR protein repeat protein [Akanthomyces lecanii RCEF 1005]|uniref:PIR protein repeat protein n=1 Tax=Akanthomyces lecanii RCEF 1005 TaxID=1081108 RepID=A0A168BHR1_CORDF|nr:PIR protein repeat protein [Akanthomyces lecanii RCEF 1005]